MRRHTPILRTLLALVLAALLAAVAWAAPVPQPDRSMPPELKSLAGIKRIGVVIAPPPRLMVEAKLEQEEIRKAVTQLLTEAGYEVVTKREQFLPILRFEFLSASDPRFENAIGFCLVMAVRQPVDLRRMELTMYTSTYQGFVIGLESREHLKKVVDKQTETLVKQFVSFQNQAGHNPG